MAFTSAHKRFNSTHQGFGHKDSTWTKENVNRTIGTSSNDYREPFGNSRMSPPENKYYTILRRSPEIKLNNLRLSQRFYNRINSKITNSILVTKLNIKEPWRRGPLPDIDKDISQANIVKKNIESRRLFAEQTKL